MHLQAVRDLLLHCTSSGVTTGLNQGGSLDKEPTNRHSSMR